MRKCAVFFTICTIGFTVHLCTSTKPLIDGLLKRNESCVCYGSTLYLDCQNDYLAFIGFSLGFTEYHGNINECSSKDIQSCSHVIENCTVPLQDSNNKMLLFQRFSEYTRSLNVRVQQRQRLPVNCDSLNGFSNYVKFDYTCIKESSILDMCSPYSANMGKIVYIGHFPGNTETNNGSCKCMVQPQSASKVNVTLLAVDIRLTSKDANCTGNHSVIISNGTIDKSIHCQKHTVIGEYSELLQSTTGNLSIKLELDENSELPESVWMAVVGDSNSEVKVVCGKEPPGGYSFTSTTNPASTSSKSGITKMSTELAKHNTDVTETDGLESSESSAKTVRILIYTCVGVVGLVALTIGGVCLKMRIRRRRLANRNRPISIDSLPGSRQSSQRMNNGFTSENSNYKVPSKERNIEAIDSEKKVRKKSDSSTKHKNGAMSPDNKSDGQGVTGMHDPTYEDHFTKPKKGKR